MHIPGDRKISSSHQIDAQQLFSKISMHSKSMESLCVSELAFSEDLIEVHETKPKSRFAQMKAESVRSEEQEQKSFDLQDKAFETRTKLIYEHFQSRPLADDKSRLFAERDLNVSETTPVFNSCLAREKLQGKINSVLKNRNKGVSESVLKNQKDLFLQAEHEWEQEQIDLDLGLIIHGYMKGLYKRVGSLYV
jgi:hypothetical protein